MFNKLKSSGFLRKNIFVILLFFCVSSVSYSQSGWVKTKLGNRPLAGVHFLNNNTGFILSYDSLFKTTNGGSNWISKNTGTGTAVLTSFKVFDEYNIIIMGQCCYPDWANGLIIRTSDGGNTWINKTFYPNHTLINAATMEWLNVNTGISVWVEFDSSNYYGRIFRTTNSGTNWSEINYGIGLGYFISIKYQNADSIYGLTNISLYKSTNQGSNWFSASNLGTGYRTKYSCPSFDTMFIGGNKIYRSVNKGLDFTETFSIDTPYVARDLEFVNAKTGFAIGSSTQYNVIKGGYIIKTTDAGINWVRQTSNTNIYTSDVFFLNENTGWVVGDSGLVLKTTTGGTTFINNLGTETPSKYSLSQNYPNPFNPSTNVKFDIVRSGDVKVVVYDVMGREVQTLVKESLKPGTYDVTFDGSMLNSGVYFYKLITDGFTETKKMLLIK